MSKFFIESMCNCIIILVASIYDKGIFSDTDASILNKIFFSSSVKVFGLPLCKVFLFRLSESLIFISFFSQYSNDL